MRGRWRGGRWPARNSSVAPVSPLRTPVVAEKAERLKRPTIDLRLSFAYSLDGGADAPPHEETERNPRFSERVHQSARVRAEPRGDRPPLRSLFARDRP